MNKVNPFLVVGGLALSGCLIFGGWVLGDYLKNNQNIITGPNGAYSSHVKNETQTKKIQEHLENKYSISFQVNPAQEKLIDNKAVFVSDCFALDNNYRGEQFKAYFWPDENKITDDYQLFDANEDFSDFIQGQYVTNTDFAGTIQVLSEIIVPETHPNFEDYDDYRNVITTCPDYSVKCYMFIEYNEYTKDDAKDIQALKDSLKPYGLRDCVIDVFYVDKVNYDNNKKHFNDVNAYTYFSNLEGTRKSEHIVVGAGSSSMYFDSVQ